MDHPSRRALILVLAALGVSACSEIDCNDTMNYQGAKFGKRLAVPEGLQPLETNDSHTVPGGELPADFVPQTCLVKPPKLVEPPADEDD